MSVEERGKMRGTRNDSTKPGEADATLRLIAGLPAPEGLAERVKNRLQAASGEAVRSRGRLLQWPVQTGAVRGWMRGAAAAAIVGVVTGGAWWIYAGVAPAGDGSAVIAPVRVHRAGGFSNAGAVHTPNTLKGPVLTHEQANKLPAEEKKQSTPAGKKSTKPAPKPAPQSK
jgi:hypothetical protein